MTNKKEIKDNIESLRELLADTIKTNGSLLDSEVVYLSKLLDILLNEFNNMDENSSSSVR